MVQTEFSEWIKKANILPLDKIICDKINKILYDSDEIVINPKQKMKGKTYIYIKQDIEKEVINRFVKTKYELINPDNINGSKK